MRAQEILLCDRQPELTSRIMFETKDGLRYTQEQWRIMKFMDRLEKKLDRLTAALERRADTECAEDRKP